MNIVAINDGLNESLVSRNIWRIIYAGQASLTSSAKGMIEVNPDGTHEAFFITPSP